MKVGRDFLTMWHHSTLRLLRRLDIPDCQTPIVMTTDELLSLVMPTSRLQWLYAETSHHMKNAPNLEIGNN